MLQHKNVDIWERATQIDSPGERLEIAFGDMYPQKLPANWKRPKVDIRSPVQNGVRKVISKPAAVSAASDTNEGETQNFGLQFQGSLLLWHQPSCGRSLFTHVAIQHHALEVVSQY